MLTCKRDIALRKTKRLQATSKAAALAVGNAPVAVSKTAIEQLESDAVREAVIADRSGDLMARTTTAEHKAAASTAETKAMRAEYYVQQAIAAEYNEMTAAWADYEDSYAEYAPPPVSLDSPLRLSDKARGKLKSPLSSPPPLPASSIAPPAPASPEVLVPSDPPLASPHLHAPTATAAVLWGDRTWYFDAAASWTYYEFHVALTTAVRKAFPTTVIPDVWVEFEGKTLVGPCGMQALATSGAVPTLGELGIGSQPGSVYTILVKRPLLGAGARRKYIEDHEAEFHMAITRAMSQATMEQQGVTGTCRSSYDNAT